MSPKQQLSEGFYLSEMARQNNLQKRRFRSHKKIFCGVEIKVSAKAEVPLLQLTYCYGNCGSGSSAFAAPPKNCMCDRALRCVPVQVVLAFSCLWYE